MPGIPSRNHRLHKAEVEEAKRKARIASLLSSLKLPTPRPPEGRQGSPLTPAPV